MNNEQFKRLLKESITSGASSLFEEEEVEIPDSIANGEKEKNKGEGDRDRTSQKNLLVKEIEKNLKIAFDYATEVKNSGNIDSEIFSRIAAYYYLGMYYNDEMELDLVFKGAGPFNRNLDGVVKNYESNQTNIVCKLNELLDWILKFPAYSTIETFVATELRSKKDLMFMVQFSEILERINEGSEGPFTLSRAGTLNKMIKYVGKDFNIKDCGAGGNKGEDKTEDVIIRTKKQQPMSLESLKAVIKKTDARDYAHKIINALKTDMKDLRVRVNEAREKTPLLTNTIKAIQSIPDKEIQKIALKSILDFFRVNNLQISDKTQSKLAKAGVLSRQDNKNPQSNNSGSDKENSEDAEVQDKEQKFNSDLEKDDSIDKEEKEVIKSTASQVKDKLGQAALAAWYGLPVDNLYNIVKEGASGNIKGVIGNIFMMLMPLDSGAKMMQAIGMGDNFSKFTDKVKEGDFLQAWDELLVALEPLDPLSKIHMLRTFATFMGKQGPRLGTIIAIIDAIGLMLAAGSAAGLGTATTGVGGGAAAAATAAGWKVAVSKILKSGLKPALIWLIEEFGKAAGYSDKELAQIKKNPEGTIRNKEWVMNSFRGIPAETMAKTIERGIRDKAFKVIQDTIDENNESEFERANTEEVPRPSVDNNDESDPEELFTESLFNHAPNFNEQRFNRLLERFDIK